MGGCGLAGVSWEGARRASGHESPAGAERSTWPPTLDTENERHNILF